MSAGAERPAASFSQEAYAQIAEMIVSGALPGGTVLNDGRLSEQLGYSRTPVREAIGRLEGEGYLVRSGRTIIVNRVDLRDVLEILAVRKLIEAETARLAAGRIAAEALANMRRHTEDLVAREDVSPGEHWAADDLVHITIAEASGNRHMAQLVADFRKRTRIFGMERIPGRFKPGMDEHLAIIAALEAGDAAAAAAAMAGHIDHARDSIIEAVTKG